MWTTAEKWDIRVRNIECGLAPDSTDSEHLSGSSNKYLAQKNVISEQEANYIKQAGKDATFRQDRHKRA